MREVAATNTHSAPLGEGWTRFEEAALIGN